MSLRTTRSPKREWHPDLPQNLTVKFVSQTAMILHEFNYKLESTGNTNVDMKCLLELRNELDRVMDEVEAQYEPPKESLK